MNLAQVPFEFPGNQQRLGDLLLPDENALANLLAENRRVWVAGFNDEVEHFLQDHPGHAVDPGDERRPMEIVCESLNLSDEETAHFSCWLR